MRLPKTYVYAAVMAFILIGLTACGGPGQGTTEPPTPDLTPQVPQQQPDPSGFPALGDPDAPITIVEFGDFSCPYCGVFALEIKPQIQKEYIDTGLVRFIWRHFPVIASNSAPAAAASTCAHEQNAFWPYHDGLYEILAQQGQQAFQENTFLRLAEQLDLNTTQFSACLKENRHEGAITSDLKNGRSLGVNATPAFFVNGNLIMGAHPYETWVEFLDYLLEEEGPN